MVYQLRERALSMLEEEGMGAGRGWGGGRRRVLQIFQKKLRSPGDHRPKYFMAQKFFQKVFHGPSHQF